MERLTFVVVNITATTTIETDCSLLVRKLLFSRLSLFLHRLPPSVICMSNTLYDYRTQHAALRDNFLDSYSLAYRLHDWYLQLHVA